MKLNSLDAICQWIDGNIDSDEVANKLIGVINAGEAVRDALRELCPDSSYADDLIDKYDQSINPDNIVEY